MLVLDIEELTNACEELRRLELVDLDEYITAQMKLQTNGLALVKVVEANQAVKKLLQVDSINLISTNLDKIFGADSNVVIREIISRILEEKQQSHIESKIYTIPGKELSVIIGIDIQPKPFSGLAVMMITDISSQKSIVSGLQESMEKYRLLMSSVNDAIVIADSKSGQIEEVNDKALELFDLSPADMIVMKTEDFFPDHEKKRYLEFFEQQCGGESIADPLDIFIRRGESETVPVQISFNSAAIGEREVVQVTFHDLSKRFKLEERRKLLATAVEQAAESVLITDTKGNIEYVNPAFEKISGYSLPEIIGQNPRILNSGQTPVFQHNLMWQEISDGKVWRGSFINKKKDGSTYREEATVTPVKDSHGEIRNYVAVKRDITKQLQLEQQISQSQKMQAIGTLAGGVAHDFNNILTAILGYAELTQALCESDSVLYSNLSEVIKGADRAGKLVDQILKFSRQTEKAVSSLKVDLIVKEVLKLLRASLPANIEIISDIASDTQVKADPTQMHQVIMNLCTNAYQALAGKGGIIKISLKRVELSPHQGVLIGNLSQGAYVCITIEDNGVGIAKEFLPRIFEPYFTTKTKHEGTGLGLSVVHGIVNDHGGAVSVESDPGVGTIFSVFLPEALPEEVDSEAKKIIQPWQPGRILVVDDEAPIVFFQEKVLKHLGYEVVSFTSSVKALRAFLHDPNAFDLIITDMGMPEITGLDLFERIREVNRVVPVILCTGYSEHVTAENAEQLGLAGYITKPFSAENLAYAVNNLFASKEQQGGQK